MPRPESPKRGAPALPVALFTGVRGRFILRSLVRLDAPVAGEDHASMYVIIWRFRPAVGREGEFERAYGPSGEWARLFGREEATSAPSYCSGSPRTNRGST